MQKKYFVRANTSSGVINFTESNILGIENFYVISGKSNMLKGYILKNVLKYIQNEKPLIECAISPFDTSELDAIIFRDTKTAIINEDCITEKKKCRVIDTDRFLSTKRLIKDKEKTDELEFKAQENLMGLYSCYKEAKIIHDEWEKIYVDNIDYDRLNKFEEGLIESLIQKNSEDVGTYNYKRFFGASVPDGSVNYIDNITSGLKNRYFIKGRPGTGKSTFLKKLVRRAEEMGYAAEIYYCSFDPKSLDMVVVPELSFCVFDSTKPHEMFPSKRGDIELDFYRESGLLGVDKKYEEELNKISSLYAFRINEGLAKLRLFSGYKKECEYYYKNCANIELADRTVDKIVRKLL